MHFARISGHIKLFIRFHLVLLFLFAGKALAQDQHKIDSLKQVIATVKQACPKPCLRDTNKINALLNLGKQYKYTIPDTAIFYYQKALKTAEQIKSKKFIVKSYNSIGLYFYHKSDYTKTLKNWKKALKIQEEISDKSGIAINFGNIGIVYQNQSNYPKAVEYYQKALKINEELGRKSGIAANLGNIGNVYDDQSNYPKALEYYQKALKINDELGNKSGIAINLGNIGNVYDDQSNYPKAVEYYHKSLKINEELGNKSGIARNLLNIGLVYQDQSNYPKALEYYHKSLKICEELGNKYGIALNLGNIGNIYENKSNYPKALKYYQKALKIQEEIGYKYGIAINLGSTGELYNDLKQHTKAIQYANQALTIAKETGALELEKSAYSVLANAYKGLNNYRKALEYKDKWIELNDSIFNTEKTKALADMNARYESEKKEQQIKQQQTELKASKALAEKEKAEKERQHTQRNLFIIAFGLMIVLAVFVFRSYRQKKKANTLLTIQKQEIAEKNEELNQQNEEIRSQRDEIEKQKNKIEKIHKEVSQSIDYAQRIQTSILPDGKIMQKYLSDYFVFFKPKDVVSGDFYWATHIENHTVIAVADCTGHGVPGAFMSMLGTSFLREIVQKEYITHTGVILRKLRKEIIKALKQTGEQGEQKDGMDMAIISINYETNVVQFSGANNPLYLITNDELRITNTDSTAVKLFDNPESFKEDISDKNLKSKIQNLKLLYEIKPDKMPIAIYEKMDSFTTHEIQLEKDDQLYLFSDGYADQFGGTKGKKFKYKPFKQLLIDNCKLTMQEQKEILEKLFEEWKGTNEQVDDITVVGIKI